MIRVHNLVFVFLIFFFSSCEKEIINNNELHEMVYGNTVNKEEEVNRERFLKIDSLIGSYKVEYITAMGQNLITGQLVDTMITYGSFELKDPIEPFDRLEIGERLKIDEDYLYGGYFLSNVGDSWQYEFSYQLIQDQSSGKWDRIEVSYFNTKRVYTIKSIGNDYLVLKTSGQWENGSNETTFTELSIHLERI